MVIDYNFINHLFQFWFPDFQVDKISGPIRMLFSNWQNRENWVLIFAIFHFLKIHLYRPHNFALVKMANIHLQKKHYYRPHNFALVKMAKSKPQKWITLLFTVKSKERTSTFAVLNKAANCINTRGIFDYKFNPQHRVTIC